MTPLLVLVCDDPGTAPVDEEPPEGYVFAEDPRSCEGEGGTPHRRVSPAVHAPIPAATWQARWGPHRLHDTVYVERLTIERGTTVCGGPGALLAVHELHAVGGDDSRIVLTAADTMARWAGVIVFDGNMELEHVTISASSGTGLYLGRFGRARGHDLRIEESGGNGLEITWVADELGGDWDLRQLRVTGSAGYPVMLPSRLMDDIVPSRFAADNLRGNGIDAVRVVFPLCYDGCSFTPYIPWHVTGGDTYGSWYLQAGATVEVRPLHPPDEGATSPNDTIHFADPFLAWGTEEAPARLVGGTYFLWSPAVLDHVHVEGASLHMAGPHSRFFDSVLDGSQVVMAGDSSFVDRVRIDGAPGEALLIDAGQITVSGCRISASGGDGIRIAPTAGSGVRINGCAFSDNAGSGVNNLSDAVVDATGNWWGSPEGPFGIAGDGVAGEVDWEPFLTVPPAPDL